MLQIKIRNIYFKWKTSNIYFKRKLEIDVLNVRRAPGTLGAGKLKTFILNEN